jgi:beta-phosphoglucomutase-like phosphatase (HAD superfamily)
MDGTVVDSEPVKRAATWNAWSDSEFLLQLAGHLRGYALQEWNLLDKDEKSAYNDATSALRTRLEHGSKTQAVQDLSHSIER